MTRGGARRAGAVRAEEFHPAVGPPPPLSSPSPGPSAATCLVSCGVRNIDICIRNIPYLDNTGHIYKRLCEKRHGGRAIQVRDHAKSGTQLHCGTDRGRRSGTAAAREPEPAAGRTHRLRLAGDRAVPWPAAARAAAGDRTDRRPEPPGPVAAAGRPRAAEMRRRGALASTRRARDRGPPRRRARDRAAAP